MVEATASSSPTPRRGQASEPWARQPGENELWFARFLRFLALGPGRSVSLVATGRRNAYPIPAHWPIQAKQRKWRERATSFDDAAKKDPKLVEALNSTLALTAVNAPNGEAAALGLVVKAGGYQSPPDDSQDDDELVSPR